MQVPVGPKSVAALFSFFVLNAVVTSLPVDNSNSSESAPTPEGPQYTRDVHWWGGSIFKNFEFMTSKQYVDDPVLNRPDPTNGFVNYVDQVTAQNASLIDITVGGSVRWGADTSNKYAPSEWGRPSIRIESKKSWTHGLFLFDIAHMPGAACGVWPALWTLGSGAWPFGGEVDILESVNLNTNNQMVIHTGDNCTMATPAGTAMAGVTDPKGKKWVDGVSSGNCAASYSTSGCPVQVKAPNNYGDAFNDNGGGVYAMQWTSDFLKMWFFPRDDIPTEVEAILDGDTTSPDVSRFGLPQANFFGGYGCDVDAHFKEHRIIFDTTFCGDWASNAWPTACPSIEGKPTDESCAIYVGANPEQYKEAYWEVRSITVFKERAGR